VLGDGLAVEDIRADYRDGVLTLTIPVRSRPSRAGSRSPAAATPRSEATTAHKVIAAQPTDSALRRSVSEERRVDDHARPHRDTPGLVDADFPGYRHGFRGEGDRVTPAFLRAAEAAGLFEAHRSEGGHRRYTRDDLEAGRPRPPAGRRRPADGSGGADRLLEYRLAVRPGPDRTTPTPAMNPPDFDLCRCRWTSNFPRPGTTTHRALAPR
jgi:hypothetical protein